ncbi:MAG TPA: hypothetical protein VKF40_31060 [Burkholderiales bacterium]|nr:hypothetical protein [Burkholderiales bacterium]
MTSPLRVSFDIDDTLVCAAAVPAEQSVPFLYRRRYPESLRRGTRALMRELHARGCRLWLYTTSGRPASYLRGWFGVMGIPLEGVVNQDVHANVVGTRGPSKFPPAFNIALHVDDSEGVAMEARAHRFHVCIVSPHDELWAERVLDAVKRLTPASAPRSAGFGARL